jgi:hypothetical protein
MQSFDEDKFSNIFKNYGVIAKKIIKDGSSLNYVGHETYRHLFYKEQFRQWKSPICPICGYYEKHKQDNSIAGHNSVSLKQTILSAITYLPKKLWPKEEKFYWIIGLFERQSK